MTTTPPPGLDLARAALRNRRPADNPDPVPPHPRGVTAAASELSGLCPLDAGVLAAGAALASAADALAILAEVLPTWSRPYLYGVAAGRSGEPRLRIGVECLNRDRLIAVGDALFPHDPALTDGDLFTTVRATVAGTPVVAYCPFEAGR